MTCLVKWRWDREDVTVKTKAIKPMLPIALQDTEITEADVAIMLRVAQDKKAPAGRYKRSPKRVASVKRAIAAKK